MDFRSDEWSHVKSRQSALNATNGDQRAREVFPKQTERLLPLSLLAQAHSTLSSKRLMHALNFLTAPSICIRLKLSNLVYLYLSCEVSISMPKTRNKQGRHQRGLGWSPSNCVWFPRTGKRVMIFYFSFFTHLSSCFLICFPQQPKLNDAPVRLGLNKILHAIVGRHLSSLCENYYLHARCNSSYCRSTFDRSENKNWPILTRLIQNTKFDQKSQRDRHYQLRLFLVTWSKVTQTNLSCKVYFTSVWRNSNARRP